MACAPCRTARHATVGAIKAVASGRLSEAQEQARIAADAIREKTESLRIRGLASRR